MASVDSRFDAITSRNASEVVRLSHRRALTAVNAFTTVSTGALTMDRKFSAAAAVGTKNVFAPLSADVIGVFETSDDTFTTVSVGAITGDSNSKFYGAAAVGTKVVFAPYSADVIGIFETGCSTGKQPSSSSP